MKMFGHRVFLALLCSMLTMCGGGRNTPGDGGMDDGGVDDGNGHSARVLRRTISVDLAQVSALVVLAQTPSGSALTAGNSRADALEPGASPGQLVAVTLTGEVLTVSFIDDENGQPGQGQMEPRIQAIFPTPTWILFSTMDFEVNLKMADGSLQLVQCRTIAARRSDGALYCAPLQTQLGGDGDALSTNAATANAAGDVVYVLGSTPSSPSRILYKILLEQEGGPAAVAAANLYVQPNRFLSNSSGDLYVNYTPSSLQPSITESKILPIDQGSPFTLQGQHNVFVVSGKPGDPDQDTFYVTHGGSGGINFDGAVSIVSKTGDSFAEEAYTPNLANVASYGFLFSLSDGLYMWSGQEKSLARVIENGIPVPEPTPIPLTGVEQFINIGGAPMRNVPGTVVFFASTGAGYKFMRHNGVLQEDIPLEAGIEPTSCVLASDGAIEFFGVRTNTHEQIHGTVAAGSTEVILVSAGVLDPAQVVVFTRIN